MLNILHVESSHFFREATKDMVEAIGHHYFSAETGKEVFEVLENTPIDLIVTALELPDESGEQLVYAINHSRFKRIPVLVLTSTDSMDMRLKLFELGVVDYLIKDSLSEERLERYIETFMKDSDFKTQISRLKIAVVDDSHLTLKMIESILSMQGISNVDYFDNAKALLASDLDYDLYTLDLVMPEMSGEDLVLQLRSHNAHAIIILISAVSNYKTISNILMSGADDYIMKPFDGNIFMARLRAHARSFLLYQELQQKSCALEKMAITDGLTGLYNHRYIMQRYEEEYSRASRYHHDFSLVLFDIDDFKHVNDNYGHQVGDSVLQELAMLMRKVVRKSDILGRYGGEEFIVLLPESSEDCAIVVAEKIREAAEQASFGRPGLQITISGGVSSFDWIGKIDMVKEADQNLYEAKRSGKNKVVSRRKKDV